MDSSPVRHRRRESQLHVDRWCGLAAIQLDAETDVRFRRFRFLDNFPNLFGVLSEHVPNRFFDLINQIAGEAETAILFFLYCHVWFSLFRFVVFCFSTDWRHWPDFHRR